MGDACYPVGCLSVALLLPKQLIVTLQSLQSVTVIEDIDRMTKIMVLANPLQIRYRSNTELTQHDWPLQITALKTVLYCREAVMQEIVSFFN